MSARVDLKPTFYCWPCDRRFTLRGDGYPPQSGIVTCRHCGSTDVYWLRESGRTGEREEARALAPATPEERVPDVILDFTTGEVSYPKRATPEEPT